VIGIGRWVPVKLPPDRPDGAELDTDHVPCDSDVAGVVAEVMGGPPVPAVAPDEWRVALALRYAEQIISAGGTAPEQADAIRARTRAGSDPKTRTDRPPGPLILCWMVGWLVGGRGGS
jgi:hypothetical protein